MTRYARANGSKSCNARVSADPTPWSEMVSPNKRAADSIDDDDVTTPKKEKKTPKKTPKVVKLEPGTPKSITVLKSPTHQTSPLVATTSAKKAVRKTPSKQKEMGSVNTPGNNGTPQSGKLSLPSPVQTRSARKKKAELNATIGTPNSKGISPSKAVKGTNLNSKTTPITQKCTPKGKGKKNKNEEEDFKLKLEYEMDSDDLDSDENMGAGNDSDDIPSDDDFIDEEQAARLKVELQSIINKPVSSKSILKTAKTPVKVVKTVLGKTSQENIGKITEMSVNTPKKVVADQNDKPGVGGKSGTELGKRASPAVEKTPSKKARRSMKQEPIDNDTFADVIKSPQPENTPRKMSKTPLKADTMTSAKETSVLDSTPAMKILSPVKTIVTEVSSPLKANKKEVPQPTQASPVVEKTPSKKARRSIKQEPIDNDTSADVKKSPQSENTPRKTIKTPLKADTMTPAKVTSVLESTPVMEIPSPVKTIQTEVSSPLKANKKEIPQPNKTPVKTPSKQTAYQSTTPAKDVSGPAKIPAKGGLAAAKTPAKEAAAGTKTPAKEVVTPANALAKEFSTPAKKTPTLAKSASSPAKTPGKDTPISAKTSAKTPIKEISTKTPIKVALTKTPAKETLTKTPVKETTTLAKTPAKEISTPAKTPAKENSTSAKIPAKEISTLAKTPAKETSTVAKTPAKEISTVAKTPAKETPVTPAKTKGSSSPGITPKGAPPATTPAKENVVAVPVNTPVKAKSPANGKGSSAKSLVVGNEISDKNVSVVDQLPEIASESTEVTLQAINALARKLRSEKKKERKIAQSKENQAPKESEISEGTEEDSSKQTQVKDESVDAKVAKSLAKKLKWKQKRAEQKELKTKESGKHATENADSLIIDDETSFKKKDSDAGPKVSIVHDMMKYLASRPVGLASGNRSPKKQSNVALIEEERTIEVRKKLLANGKTDEEIDRDLPRIMFAIKKRVEGTRCHRCRNKGHMLRDCPVSKVRQAIKCYKCGETSHTSKNCAIKEEVYTHAECFICRQTGHLTRTCPSNTNGIYPKGGACFKCGDKSHLSKFCPGNKRFQDEKDTSEIIQKKAFVGVLNVKQSADADVTYEPGVKAENKALKQGGKKRIVKF